jgi:RND family efflux transporter MFP subunit
MAAAALCALASTSAAPLAPVGTSTPSNSTATVRTNKLPVSCLTSPERVVDIGSSIVGVVSSVKVDVGDRVRKGDLLITLAAGVERAGVVAAQARSDIDADVLAAQANLELATQRHQQAQQLQSQGFVSSGATEQARVEREIAAQKLQQARGQRRVSSSELGVVQAQLRQRKSHSPFDGMVIERYVNPGERVEDKPMLRVAKLDPLRVDLVMPASRYGSVAVKDSLRIQPDLPGVAAKVAQVTHVDPVIDSASNTFRVRLRLPNPGNTLPAGVRCRLETPGAELAGAFASRPTQATQPR